MTESAMEDPGYKLLIPVDGSENSTRAVKQAARLAKTGAVAGIDLLHVQPPLLYIEMLIGSQQTVIEQWSNKQGREATEAAARLLGEVGVAFELHFESGEVAETIVAHAARCACDLIIMGTRGMGAHLTRVTGTWAGSVATKVIHLAQVPVTLVK
jgi:nucleotide-binding universal stress UspA family protein